MSNLRQAAEAALEALEAALSDDQPYIERCKQTRTALRAALENGFNPDWDAMAVMVKEQMRMAKRIAELEAQPEQEPVAWMVKLGDVTCFQLHANSKYASAPLYTAPPQRKPLTDEEIDNCWYQSGGVTPGFARAIEAAHGIKGEA